MNRPLAQQVVVISGASSGIGHEAGLWNRTPRISEASAFPLDRRNNRFVAPIVDDDALKIGQQLIGAILDLLARLRCSRAERRVSADHDRSQCPFLAFPV